MYDKIINTFNYKKSDAYKAVFSTPEGKEVLKDLIEFCHVNDPTHVIGDTHQTAYREGERRVALRILGFLKGKKPDLEDVVQPQTINE